MDNNGFSYDVDIDLSKKMPRLTIFFSIYFQN